jgi:hypothetical protein
VLAALLRVGVPVDGGVIVELALVDPKGEQVHEAAPGVAVSV